MRPTPLSQKPKNFYHEVSPRQRVEKNLEMLLTGLEEMFV
jgi:hypothetical protein